MFVVDARSSPGQILEFHEPTGHFVPRYSRPRGGVSSIAFSKDRRLLFADANDRKIFQTDGISERVVYEHSTYVRDLAFDNEDLLHFSEAFGAGRDGAIFSYDFRSREPRASLRRDVRVTQLDGFWSGNFTFDKARDTHGPDTSALFVSSGNRRPASLYLLERRDFRRDEPPRRLYSRANGSISGIYISGKDVFFADWKDGVRRLEDFRLETLIRTVPGAKWLSDVAFIPPLSSERPCSVSGRLIAPRDVFPLYYVLVYGPNLRWTWIEEGVRLDSEGRYEIRNLPRGTYWISLDTRGDSGRRVLPAVHHVESLGGRAWGLDFRLE